MQQANHSLSDEQSDLEQMRQRLQQISGSLTLKEEDVARIAKYADSLLSDVRQPLAVQQLMGRAIAMILLKSEPPKRN